MLLCYITCDVQNYYTELKTFCRLQRCILYNNEKMSALLAHFVVTSVLDVMEMCIGPIIESTVVFVKCHF